MPWGLVVNFRSSHQLFQRWTGIELTEKTLANQVEKTGNKLQTKEFDFSKEQETKAQSESTNKSQKKPDLLYVGVDGVMTPLNQKQGYKEAKVGVIFWGKDHQKVNGKRGVIRQREYIATLKYRKNFTARVEQLYQNISLQQQPGQTIVIGDGAHWIWSMALRTIPRFSRNSRFFSSLRICVGSC